MTTINKVIALVDEMAPNAVPAEQKAAWIIALDGQLMRETLHGRAIPNDDGKEETVRDYPHRYPDDADMELLVPAPWESVYAHYLAAMIAYWNRDTSQYANSWAMYEADMQEFKEWYIREHRPPAAKHFIVW